MDVPGIPSNTAPEDTTLHVFYALVATQPGPVGHDPLQMPRIAVAASAVPETLALRSDFAREVLGWDEDGDFSSAFPDLVELSALYAPLPVDTANVLLQRDFERLAERDAAILGQEIPGSIARRAGPSVILALLLYHLAFLRTLGARPSNTSWLGALPGAFARTVSVAMVPGLPVATIALLAIAEPSGLWRVAQWAASLCVAGVACCTVWRHAKIHRRFAQPV
jgi:hypothetical protein